MKKQKPEWVKGSFLDNFDAAALRLGYRYMPLAWGLAKVNWTSTVERDDFLNMLTRQQVISE